MRSVLITGTSSGIGLTTVVALATRGWRVFATMRDLNKRGLLDQALRDAGSRNGVEIEQLDVANGTSIKTTTETILSRTGNKLDAVVHNAGVAAAGALEDVPEAELRRVMETNFFGTGVAGSSSFRVRLPSWVSPPIRSIAHRNGRSKDGPSLWPMNLRRSRSTSCS